MIVGTAEVLIVPVTKGFQKALKDESAPGFASLKKDAESAGEDAGLGLRTGVKKQTGKLADDVERDGARAGEGLHKGMSGGLSKLAGTISATGLPLGGLTGGLEKAGKAAEDTGRHSGGLASSLDRLGGVAAAGAAGGLLVVAGAGLHVGEAMQSAETKIAGAAGTTVASAEKIGSAFLSTAGKSEFSGVQMAQAFSAVAGQLKSTEGHALSAAEATTVMSAASDLAAAKQIDLGSATGALAKVMQAFHISAGDAAHASDVLFQASSATGQSVDALGNQLAKVKSKLGDTGGSIGDLAGLLVDMTNQGITGRASLGALNASMTTLQKTAEGVATAQQTQNSVLAEMDPKLRTLAEGYAKGTVSQKDYNKETGNLSATQKQLATQFASTQTAIATAQTKYKELGVTVFDAQGKFVGMGSIIDQLHPRFAKMTQDQQLAAATTLFGAGAARQMTAVINAGPAAYDKATASVNKHGAAQSAAAQQAKTLHGEEATLKAEMSDLAARVGAVLIPVLTTMIGVFVKATAFVTSHKAVLIALGAVVTGILAPAIAVFTVNKMAAFSKSFVDAAGHVKSFADDVEKVVTRVISAFTKQNAATKVMGDTSTTQAGRASSAVKQTATDTETSAGRVETAEGTMATEVTAASSTVEGENTAAGASFTTMADEAAAADTAVEADAAATAGAVTAADTTIEGANAAAGSSFTALAATAAPILGALGVAAAGTAGGVAAANALSGGQGITPGTSPQNPLPNSPGGSGFNVGPLHFGGAFGSLGNTLGLGGGGPSYVPAPGVVSPAAASLAGGLGIRSASASAAAFGVPPTPQAKAIIAAAAAKYGISPALLWGVYGTETSYGTNVQTSSAGAVGPFQFEPGTARSLGINPYDFTQAAYGAAHYLSEFSNRGTAGMLSAYNAGPAGALQPAYVNSVLADARTYGSVPATAPAPSAPLYVNPLGQARSVVTERTDMGVDYSAAPGSPIDALGAGKIVKILQNWYKGQPLIEEQLSSGPKAGQFVYYAEQLNSLVHEQQQVKAGQQIATVAGSGTGLELGFGAPGGQTLAAATTGYREGQATPAGQAFGAFMGQIAAGQYRTGGAAGSNILYPQWTSGPSGPVAAAQPSPQQIAAAQIAQLKGALDKEIAAQKSEITRLRAGPAGGAHHPPSAAQKSTVAAEVAAINQKIADEKGLYALQVASIKQTAGELTKQQAAALKQETADVKAAQSESTKLTADIHKGSLQTLRTDLDQAHTKALSQLVGRLDADHNRALAALATKLVQVHTQAMAALVKAEQNAADMQWLKDQTAILSKEATDATRAASLEAQGIADQTKIFLDGQSEQGKAGLDLQAAQAQTALDTLAAADNQLVGQAQAALDSTAALNPNDPGTPYKQAQAGLGLAQAQAQATIDQANSQATLDKASAAAAAAQAAAQAAQSATPTPAAAAPSAPSQFNFEIYGNGTLTAAQLFSEVGWAIRTGALPVAPPVPAPAHA